MKCRSCGTEIAANCADLLQVRHRDVGAEDPAARRPGRGARAASLAAAIAAGGSRWPASAAQQAGCLSLL